MYDNINPDLIEFDILAMSFSSEGDLLRLLRGSIATEGTLTGFNEVKTFR